MAKRSLKASEAGQIKAKRAFDRTGLTQEALAYEVGLQTRQSVWKFFTGRPIERYIFIDICFFLGLEWQEITESPQQAPPAITEEASTVADDGDDLVNVARSRSQDSILARCSQLQSSLDMSRPRPLEEVYTDIQFLTRPSNQRWLETSEVVATEEKRASFLRFSGEIVSGDRLAESTDKVFILGKPGAGKTTFLQHLATQCIQGKFRAQCVPVFLQLRHWFNQSQTEFNLLSAIAQPLQNLSLSQAQVETLLRGGNLLVLLDGLDEIPSQHVPTVVNQIQAFAQTYYQNPIFITCRISSQLYRFKGFTYVEIADFEATQIDTFAQKWFIANSGGDATSGQIKATRFLEQLRRDNNQPLRELAVTPILLDLLCSVFAERDTFPKKRSRLYQVGLDILLSRWDEARGVQREQVYRRLSVSRKLKLLVNIATATFEKGHYAFEKNEVVRLIAADLKTLASENTEIVRLNATDGETLPNFETDPETLWRESELVLNGIALQHGLLVERAKAIYSFSHITFQEYLTALGIFARMDTVGLKEGSAALASRVHDPQWRTVLALTASMLPEATFLLSGIQQEINRILETDSQSQAFLASLNKKVQTLKISCQPAAARAFYLTLFQDRDLKLALAIDKKLGEELPSELALDRTLVRALSIASSLAKTPNMEEILNLEFTLDIERSFSLDETTKQSLQSLKDQLPDLEMGREKLEQWWQEKGQNWVQQFQVMMIECRGIAHNWQFTPEQQEKLQRYYQGNLFLMECLRNECQIVPEIQKEIEETLLRPKKMN